MIVKNPDLGNGSFLWKAFTREEFWYSDAGFLPHFRNYRPLLLVWFWIDYNLFGLNPAPWHACNVAVHLIAVWLVFKISRRLAGESTPALLAAVTFGLTPIHTAAVEWMAGSCYMLGTTLALGAFYLIMPRTRGTRRNWAIAMVLYAGALLCHESAVAFPALVAVYAFFFESDGLEGEPVESSAASLWTRLRRAVIWQAPFAIEVMLYFVARLLVLGFFVSNPYDYMNLLTNTQAVLTVPLVFLAYLTMLLMPWLIRPNHEVLPVSSASAPEFWAPLAAIALLVAALVFVARRDPRRRLHLFCLAWMGITLAPMMILHSLPHIVQDYYLYLPSVGWCILVGDVIASLVRREDPLTRRLVLAATTAMLIVYAAALWRAEWFWHDDVEAGTAFVEGDPISVGWRWNLAYYLEQDGNYAQAESEIRTALNLEPDVTGIYHPHSSALHHILGELLARRGDIDGAVSELSKSVNGPPDEDEVHPPRLPLAYNHDGISLYNRGLDDARRGRVNQSIAEITKGLAMMKRAPVPDYEPLAMRYLPLAELYDSIGDQKQVEAVLDEVDSMPEGELAVGLARARIRMKHSDKLGAERILRELLDRYPDNYEVLMQLANLEFSLKQYKEALTHYQRAGAGWLITAQLHSSIAKTFHALGRDHEALDQCRLADALGAGNWEAQFSCAQIRSDIANK